MNSLNYGSESSTVESNCYRCLYVNGLLTSKYIEKTRLLVNTSKMDFGRCFLALQGHPSPFHFT